MVKICKLDLASKVLALTLIIALSFLKQLLLQIFVLFSLQLLWNNCLYLLHFFLFIYEGIRCQDLDVYKMLNICLTFKVFSASVFLFLFFIMIYKYTFNTHQMTNNKKSTIIRLEHTKTGSTQNGVCLVELRILYSNL